MANRIYIAIGLIAILILGAAFIVPWFIDWNSYKGRMEQMAAEALGVEVAIGGQMDFTLLPQPRLHFEDVRIGPEGEEIGTAGLVEADLSLMDFLRDRFAVTELRLLEPRLNLVVDENGELQTPVTLAETATASNVSIANARFQQGTITVTDRRSGDSWEATGVTGDMQMDAIRGPFAINGQAQYEGKSYTVRAATSAMNAQGQMQLSALLRPVEGPFSVSVEGLLQTGGMPEFDGQLSYRRFAVPRDDAVVGDMLLRSPVTADATAIELPEFTLLPDENQAATRLTGSATLTLGESPRFEASVSGGVVTVLPVEVGDDAPRAFGLVRLLREMPQPMIPPLPGRLAMSINELGVRGTSIRDVRLDATSDGDVWSVDEFSGRISGDTTIKLTGTLGRAAGWPAFEGTLAMSSARLDALSLMWKRPQEGNPLFGMSGSLNGQVQLVNDRLRIEDGVLVLDDTTHAVSADMRFGDTPSLAVVARLSTLSRPQSEGLLALLPPLDPRGAFGLSFPQGELDLEVERARVMGQVLEGLNTTAAWDDEGLHVPQVELENFGGMGFSGALAASGTLESPTITGQGELSVERNASVVDLVLSETGAAEPLRGILLRSLPMTMDVELAAPGRDGIQSAALEGRARNIDVTSTLDMTGGILGLGREQLGLTLDAAADSGPDLFDQLGAVPLIASDEGIIASARLFGNPRGSMDSEISIEGGGERFDFSGRISVADSATLQGEGQASFMFLDSIALSELVGAEGIWLPPVEGQAELSFVGEESVQLSAISAQLGEREITGNLSYAAQRNSALVSGALAADALDMETLAAMLAGPAALVEGEQGFWPDGPVDLGPMPRSTRGRIAITAPVLMAGGERLVEALALDYAWGEEDAGLRGLFGEIGGGTVQLDAALCCASAVESKSLTGRFTLNGVSLEAILPEASSAALSGTLTLGAQFQGSGTSYRELADALNGEASFTLEDLVVERLSPSAFEAAANVEDLTEVEPDALEELVATALDTDAFRADEVGGLVSLIAGTARVSNVAIDGDGARLLGGGTLDLQSGDISGQWSLALTRMLAGNGLITETTGRIGIEVSGTLAAPERSLDLGPMVDAIQMRAYELELDELESLRAEQEARQQRAAEEQARQMEEQARRAAEQLLTEQQENPETSDDTQILLDDIGILLNEQEGATEDEEAEPDADAPGSQEGQEDQSVTVFPPGTFALEPSEE